MPREDTAKENAAIYARFSSSGQREESIEGQLRECKEYAARLGMHVVGEYCDYAISGTSDKRPEFQRMVRDSAKGLFTVVITWKNDRFARNRYDSALYKYRLKQNGVRLLYARESIPDGPEGIILESVMEGYAEYYSANLSQNVKRGMYDSAMKLRALARPPYGLRRAADGTFEINPETAPIVRRIFDEYASGRPAKEIYKKLNEEGYRTSTDRPFNKNSIRQMLKNEKYCGIYRYADIYVEDGIPALVSKELFADVQKMLLRHHEKPAEKKIDGGFLLSGKLFCGHCGAPMTGDGGTGKSGQVYKYYTCVNHRLKTCPKKRAPKQWIEDLVIAELRKIAGSDKIVTAFVDRYMEWQAKNREKSLSEVKGLRRQLRQVESAIGNSLAAIDKGLLSDSLKEHLTELETKKCQLADNIARQEVAVPYVSREEAMAFLQQFREADDSVAQKIFLVETFLKAVYLRDEDLILCLNFTGEKSKFTLKTAQKALSRGVPLCSDFAQQVVPRCAKMNTRGAACFFAGFLVVSVLRQNAQG